MTKIYIKFIILLTFILSYCSIINSTQNNSITITFIGDVIMHGPVKSFALRNNIVDPKTKKSINNNGFDILFENIKSEFESSNHVVANMEFPVAPPYTSKAFIFNCQPQVLDAFKNININIVSLANNHILDQGYEGLIATLQILELKKIQYVGVSKKDNLKQNGLIIGDELKVGIVAYTGVFNYELSHKYKNSIYINNIYDTKKVLSDITDIKNKCDFLVMIAHIGSEYSTQPSKSDMNMLRMYCEAGVDCVIGHHPHVIQPVEQIKTSDGRICTIFYSLGNFIANQSSTHIDSKSGVNCSTREGLIVRLLLKKQNEKIYNEYTVIPIFIYNIPETDAKYKYGRRIQPISFKKHIAMQNEKYNNSENTKEFQNRLNDIKKHLFLYGKYDNIIYSD
ncbi:MAG: CapA family protein [Spirochaetes bacterium]|nr:CapA family protein [Spirochaetota bacterium]